LTYEILTSNVFVLMANQLPRPTDAELEILTVLWSIGPATVRQVYEVLQRRRSAQYSTTLKFMQIMTDKGLVTRDEAQRAHVYAPARPREWTQRQLVGHLLERGFSGSAKDLLVGALSARRASNEELAEMRKLLSDYRKEEK
jgi:BlaI family transcriptional regulator, penicillinase repressor